MSDHITEHTLELLILTPEEISSAEKEAIGLHLSECALCGEHWRKLNAFYTSVNKSLDEPPTQRDAEFAEELLARPERLSLTERGSVRQEISLRETIESYAEEIEPYRRGAIQRFVRWARFNPIKFAGATTFAVAALAMLTMTVRTPKDTNPTFAEVKNAVLNVYDKEGRVLWTRSAVGLPDLRSDEGWDRSVRGQRILSVDDIDGDRVNEVLLSGSRQSTEFSVDTLYCFESDGRLRWRTGVGEMISFGKQGIAQHTTGVMVDWLKLKRNAESPTQFFIAARDHLFSPAKLLELNPKTGKELHAYYNRGHAEYLLATDIDHDGNVELVLGGLNDSFNSAFIAILDPQSLSGYASVMPHHFPSSAQLGTEQYYVLFPRTEVGNAVSSAPYNQVTGLTRRASGGLIVQVDDIKYRLGTDTILVGGVSYPSDLVLDYTFGPDMRCSRVVAGDGSQPLLDELYKSGRIKHRFTPEEVDALKDSILYWNGERFVHTPTRNKRYSLAEPLP